ncbi:vegetative cell wall protein gp1-like [Aphis craccivora]|uniref:Vegetative cell wall protein gp1-like n=1 Tax=Aphis craccivora TaxID=307492 RepID=A0A6G0VRF1_APHCR|nr:vegetative cell wall protein gp1-like [Aphis craccivora]
MSGQNGEKWQQVADLIARLGLMGANQPTTAAQVNRMTTQQLLQDPVRAAIYRRGWDDRTADIQRTLQYQPRSTRLPPTTLARPPTAPARTPQTAGQRSSQPPAPRPPRLSVPRPAAPTAVEVVAVRVHSPVTIQEPAPVPGPSGAPVISTVKERTEAQLERNRKKFRKLREKMKARGDAASQQHRLAKHPRPESNPESASQPAPEPSTSTAMEVDIPATEGETPEEPVATTSQTQLSQAARREAPS